MVDISGAWVWRNLVFVITKVNDKYNNKFRFVWRMINKQGGISTGIGEQTGLDSLWVVWDCDGGNPTAIEGTHGKVIIDENGKTTRIDWGDGTSFLRSPKPE